METNDIKFLAELMKKNDITKLDFEDGKIKLKLERAENSISSIASGHEKETSHYVDSKQTESNTEETKNYIEVKSPMIGVYYSSKAPGEPPYVEAGAVISKGDILCLIETMKIMNEIPSEVSGTISEVCVKNGQIVEYGQVLFKIK